MEEENICKGACELIKRSAQAVAHGAAQPLAAALAIDIR